MKRLYVLRHAKSSWDDTSLADFDRPLNSRGRSAAPFMGNLMRERRLLPQLVVSSPAARARETAKLAAGAAGLSDEIRFDERVYEASTATLVTVMSEFASHAESAMIVGHNPGMEGLVRYVTGEVTDMPTAALAVIDLEIDAWSAIGENTGKLVEVLRPKESGYLT
jgi:phosphohistidine phosphatase